MPGTTSRGAGPSSRRRCATSSGEQTRPSAPAFTARRARRSATSAGVPAKPSACRSPAARLVSTVTARSFGAATPAAAAPADSPRRAAAIISLPPLACTVTSAARLPFHLAVRQALLPDRDAQREPDEIGVLELHPGALVPVVEEDLHAGGREVAVQLLRDLAHLRVLHLQRQQGEVQRSHAHRPANPIRVVVQLDRSRQDALDADAVAPHHDGNFLARLVEHARAHRLRVARAKLEDVPYLERLADRERFAAARASS